MAKPITQKTIATKTRGQMQKLGTYKKEFDPVIEIYAGMLFQYQAYVESHAAAGYPVTEIYVNNAGAENERKVPILNVMESLRKDILAYSDRLMLNPKSLGEIVDSKMTDSPLKNVFAAQKKAQRKRMEVVNG